MNKDEAFWVPIGEAPRVAGQEIVGCRWHDGVMSREPFISFWSPTLNKFYCDPTHYIAVKYHLQSSADANRVAVLEAALRSIAANTCCDKCQEAGLVARAALAKTEA